MQLLRVRIGEIQVASQHRHIQSLFSEHPADMRRYALRQRGRVPGHSFYYLRKGKMHAAEALFLRLRGPRFHGLQLRRLFSIDIVQTYSDL